MRIYRHKAVAAPALLSSKVMQTEIGLRDHHKFCHHLFIF